VPASFREVVDAPANLRRTLEIGEVSTALERDQMGGGERARRISSAIETGKKS
jgi:hypothetical protein